MTPKGACGRIRISCRVVSGSVLSLPWPLTCKPDLIVADEPTTALDTTVQRQILDLLIELVDETGVALLLITHNLAIVSEIADRVLVMYGR